MPKLPAAEPKRFHHIFSQRTDLAQKFAAAGINIDDMTIAVPLSLHKQIHGGGRRGGRWNQAWEDFFANNPSAQSQDIFKEAGRLLYEFEIPGGPIVKYPR